MNNIIKKWGFISDEFEQFIKQGYQILSNGQLNKNEIEYIRKEILTLENFGNNDLNDKKSKKIFGELKDLFLKEIMWLYYNLDKKLIDWLIELASAEIFNQEINMQNVKIPIEKQLDYTLRNYETYSKKLLSYAKDLFFNKPNLIQIAENSSSFCEYFKIIEKALVIINPEEAGYVLNHETEHFIERQLGLPNNDPYLELGSIYFELLFTDLLYEKEGILIRGKIKDMGYDITVISEYLIVAKEFAKYNFQVSDEIFKKVFLEKIYIIPEELEEYLEKQLEDDNIANGLIYLISFLKAIELRELTLTSNEDSFDILKPYLQSKKLIFNPSTKLFSTYEKYIDEIKQKSLTK